MVTSTGETSALYKITNHSWQSEEGYRWGRDTRCNARLVESAHWLTLQDVDFNYITAYKHPVLASLLCKSHIDIKKTLLWEGCGVVVKEDQENRVFCSKFRTIDIVNMPVIGNLTRMRFGFGAVAKVNRHLIFHNFILDFFGSHRLSTKRINDVMQPLNVTMQEGPRDKSGRLTSPESIAAFAAHCMCFAALAYDKLQLSVTESQREENTSSLHHWTSRAVLEANRAAHDMGIEFDLTSLAELSMAAR